MKIEDMIDLDKDLKLSPSEFITITEFAATLYKIPDRHDAVPLLHISPDMRPVLALVIAKGLEALEKEVE